jgi:DNA polymerase I-like protein with 3'-5' exonuclease and polymerase domains
MKRELLADMNRLTIRCNTPVQGAGAAILKLALGNLWPLVKEAGEDTVKIAAAVHDEILLLVREEAAEKWAKTLKQVMEEAEAHWLGDIPALAEVSTGKTWEETH